MQIRKIDEERQIVYGEIYIPNKPDSQGHFMDEGGVIDMAHAFMESMRVHKVDQNHDNHENGSFFVESFIAREGDPDFIPGSWVGGVKVTSSDLWKQVKEQEINGFSMEGTALVSDAEVEIEVPDQLIGDTFDTDGHAHKYQITFHDDGAISGRTDEVDGHYHKILRGSVTEESENHSHRFSFLEQVDLEVKNENDKTQSQAA